MTNISLAASYLKKARDRLDILDLLQSKEAYSDVVREAQEIVELALKGMLRLGGIDPPKHHEVGGLLLEHRDKYPEEITAHFKALAHISKKLRKERELSFYGDIDFIPTEEYSGEDADQAREGAQLAVRVAERLRAIWQAN
jgi:hypothetical protein